VSEKETAHEGANIAAMQADIASARADFLASLTELREQTAPAALAQRGLRAAGGWFTDEFGGVRPERVAIAGAVVVGIVAIKLLRRRGR
jgi:nitrate/nitrite transporter NarK